MSTESPAPDRDERFVQAFASRWNAFANATLRLAHKVHVPYPWRLQLATLFEDTAFGVGCIAGEIYSDVRDAGDLIRWLLTGKTP